MGYRDLYRVDIPLSSEEEGSVSANDFYDEGTVGGEDIEDEGAVVGKDIYDADTE